MSKHPVPGKMTVPCPICRKKVARDNEFFPFCSKRCQTTDLGNWASGEYAVAGDDAFIPDMPDDYA